MRLEADRDILEDWIDKTVSPSWGRQLAARTYNIIRTATDGKVNWSDMINPTLKETPHKIRVEPESPVPGQKPAENMYDIMNALTWISSHQETLSTRYQQMRQVPRLIDSFATFRLGKRNGDLIMNLSEMTRDALIELRANIDQELASRKKEGNTFTVEFHESNRTNGTAVKPYAARVRGISEQYGFDRGIHRPRKNLRQ